MHRLEALEELGWRVRPLSLDFGGGLKGRIQRLISKGGWSPTLDLLNREALNLCSEYSFDLVWIDKGWMMYPHILRRIRTLVGNIVLFNNDNPWGQLEPGIWRNLINGLKYYDAVIIPRYSTVANYLSHGVRRVYVSDFGFCPSEHRPDPNLPMKYDVTFIGTRFHDGVGVRPNRDEFLFAIARLFPGKLSIFGHGWAGCDKKAPFAQVGPARYGHLYRETISSSFANLAFVTWANQEESSHKAFEIAASAGLLLAERTPKLERSFDSNTEALFFTTVEECAEHIEQILGESTRRNEIAQAGRRRCLQGGYDNKSRLRQVIADSDLLREYLP